MSKSPPESENENDLLLSFNEIKQERHNHKNKWVNQGSDAEIISQRVVNHRDLLCMKFARKRKYFGKLTQHTTTDASDSYKFCTSVVDPNFTVFKKERDFGVQNVPEKKTSSVQTLRFRKVNKSTQVVTEESYVSDEKIDDLELAEFLHKVEPEIRKVIHQTSVIPIFEDDFENLGTENSFVGRKSASVLREHQSFTHIEYSKNKVISSIDWQPNSKGVIAFSCLNSSNYEESLKNYGKSKTSYVVVWNFSDPIYPQVILTSPSDVLCIQFNKVNPNLIVGGLANGQVILWDISDEDKTFEFSLNKEIARDHIKTLVWKQISLIEYSHKSPVNDIKWVPEGYHIHSNGTYVKLEEGQSGIDSSRSLYSDENTPMQKNIESHQFFSVGSDGKMLVWDTNKNHLRQHYLSKKRKNEKMKESWLPLLIFSLTHHSDLSDVTCMKLDLNKNDLYKCVVTSQEGDLVICNWSIRKKMNSQQGNAKPNQGSVGIDEKGKNIVIDSYRTRDGGHFGVASSVERHPFLEDIYLTVGDWSCKIWKVGFKSPLWTSFYANSTVVCGVWSPTRAGVFYTGRSDGVIEVWDFLDKSYEPSMKFNVSQREISCMKFRIVNIGTSSRISSQQYLGVGSKNGTLHIVEVPLNLIREATNEKESFQNFLEKEEEKVKYYQKRWKIHQRELKEKELMEKHKVPEKEEEEEELAINYTQIIKQFHEEFKKFSEDDTLLSSI